MVARSRSLFISVLQNPLAYLTAMTHGMEDVGASIAASVADTADGLPQVNPTASLLLPPEPLVRDQENWPLLTGVSMLCTLRCLLRGALDTLLSKTLFAYTRVVPL